MHHHFREREHSWALHLKKPAAEKEQRAVNCACCIHPFENYRRKPWMFFQTSAKLEIASSCFDQSWTVTAC